MLAQYADRGAEQIEHFGGYLRGRDTGQLVTDVEGFARRQPIAFAGGAFALGMLAVRFLRSRSQPQGQSLSSPSSTSYGASYGGSSTSTAPMAGSTGSGMTPGSASMPPGGYTAAAQAALNRTPASRTTVPSRSASSTGTSVNPGTPAAPGSGPGTPGTRSDLPTSRPPATPPAGSTPAETRRTPPTPESGARTGSGSSASERTGAGSRSQP
jgi:hypothetical protein